MTLTAPNCWLRERFREVERAVRAVPGVSGVA
jgi:metal-sulfur cluster biosynthetic enzyme